MSVVGGGAPRVIGLEEGWKEIDRCGLQKLFRLLHAGGLQEQSSAAASSASNSVQKQPQHVTGFTNEEYAQLYTIIYQMCIQKAPHCWTPQLYERYELSINQYLNSILPEVLAKSGPYLISEVVRRWEEHGVMRKWMYDFFRYLDRFYVKRHGKKALSEVALQRFRVLLFDKVKQKLGMALLDAIRRDRNGDETDRPLLHKCVRMYVELGGGGHSLRLYQAELERPLLEESRTYYTIRSAQWIHTDSCPDYLRKCEQAFRDEKKRVQDYLVPHTEVPLLNVMNEALLVKPQRELLEKEHTGLRALLKAHADSDIARMYALYSAVPVSLPFIANILQAHITLLGTSLFASSSTAATAAAADGENAAAAPAAAGDKSGSSGGNYIEELMKMHDTYFELVRTAFHGHGTFQRALKEAFSTIVNRPASAAGTAGAAVATPAELLATYADDVLRKGGLQLEGPQLERTLDNIVRLFSYLTDKDLFGEFYRKQLATRLLSQRSSSSDAEKSMIGKLKLSMGAQFTSKLEGMFNDMRNAAEHAADFARFVADRQMDLGGVEFVVHTLTTGFWPSYPIDELKLPANMQQCIDAFHVYYNTRTNNRRLRWIHELGSVSLAAHFPKRRLELVVSTLQAVVLLQFNEGVELSIQQLSDVTAMPPDLMKQTLKSLVSGRAKIMLKSPAEGYSVSHKMRVNPAFTSASLRVRVPPPVRKSAALKEREGAAVSVAEERKHSMEANIVRIMKARKVMQHQQLMVEVSQQLMKYFQPDPRQIKQRIEDLIQREYMRRDEESSNTYHYLA